MCGDDFDPGVPKAMSDGEELALLLSVAERGSEFLHDSEARVRSWALATLAEHGLSAEDVSLWRAAGTADDGSAHVTRYELRCGGRRVGSPHVEVLRVVVEG